MDISIYSLDELQALQGQITDAIASKKLAAIKAEQAAFKEIGAKKYAERINVLKNQYDKLERDCKKSKSVTLRVKMTVNLDTNTNFEELLEENYQHGFREVFIVNCKGELLNGKDFEDFGDFADTIQEEIDNFLHGICEGVLQIDGNLCAQAYRFLDDFNKLMGDFGKEPKGLSLLTFLKKGKK